MASDKLAARKVKMAKMVAMVLRHQAARLQLPIWPDGSVLVEDLWQTAQLVKAKLARHNLEEIVRNDVKGRFHIHHWDGKQYIRACQGHSIPQVNMNADFLDENDVIKYSGMCYHGTYASSLPAILATGLQRRSRNCIHFAVVEVGGQQPLSGPRSDCAIAIVPNLVKAVAMGMTFSLSINEVLLTEGIEGALPVACFDKIVDLKSGKVLLDFGESANTAQADFWPASTREESSSTATSKMVSAAPSTPPIPPRSRPSTSSTASTLSLPMACTDDDVDPEQACDDDAWWWQQSQEASFPLSDSEDEWGLWKLDQLQVDVKRASDQEIQLTFSTKKISSRPKAKNKPSKKQRVAKKIRMASSQPSIRVHRGGSKVSMVLTPRRDLV